MAAVFRLIIDHHSRRSFVSVTDIYACTLCLCVPCEISNFHPSINQYTDTLIASLLA